MSGVNHWYVALSGALPALLAMWWVDRLDRKRPEPRGLRRRVAIYGGLSVIPVLIIAMVLEVTVGASVPHTGYLGAAWTSFVTAAAIEELCKIGVIYWVFSRPEFDERLDGIVYAGRAGLGFALVENILYLLGQVEMSGLLLTWVLRALLAVPGHAMWTGIMGYFVARRRFDHVGPGIVGGYLVAVALHGVYDFVLFVMPVLEAEGFRELALAMVAVPVIVIGVSFKMLRHMARRALHLDDAISMGARGSVKTVTTR